MCMYILLEIGKEIQTWSVRDLGAIQTIHCCVPGHILHPLGRPAMWTLFSCVPHICPCCGWPSLTTLDDVLFSRVASGVPALGSAFAHIVQGGLVTN